MTDVMMSLECKVTCPTESCKNYGLEIPAKIVYMQGKEPNVICGVCCQIVASITPTADPVELTD